MNTPRPHGHARTALEPGLVRETVNHQPVHSSAEGCIGQRLEREGMVLPSCSFRIGREGFGGNDRFTPSVRRPGHGRGMMEPGVIVRFVPELGHRHIGAGGVSEIVQRAVAIAFDN